MDGGRCRVQAKSCFFNLNLGGILSIPLVFFCCLFTGAELLRSTTSIVNFSFYILLFILIILLSSGDATDLFIKPLSYDVISLFLF